MWKVLKSDRELQIVLTAATVGLVATSSWVIIFLLHVGKIIARLFGL